MAEIVEYRVEKTINELRQLKQIGVFTKAQVREIVSKRQNFEYGLRKRTKNKLDYLKYIQYEMELLSNVKEFKQKLIEEQKNIKRSKDLDQDKVERKLNKLKIKLTVKVMRNSALHISTLFRQLTIRYQFDKDLWLAYIEFAKSLNWHERVSALYWRTLRVHNTDETIWIQAAKYEYQTRRAFEMSRKLFLRAIKHHPTSISVWSEFAIMELDYIDFIKQRKDIIVCPDKPLVFKLQGDDGEEDSNEYKFSQGSITSGKLFDLVVQQACASFTSSSDQQQFLSYVKVRLPTTQ